MSLGTERWYPIVVGLAAGVCVAVLAPRALEDSLPALATGGLALGAVLFSTMFAGGLAYATAPGAGVEGARRSAYTGDAYRYFYEAAVASLVLMLGSVAALLAPGAHGGVSFALSVGAAAVIAWSIACMLRIVSVMRALTWPRSRQPAAPRRAS